MKVVDEWKDDESAPPVAPAMAMLTMVLAEMLGSTMLDITSLILALQKGLKARGFVLPKRSHTLSIDIPLPSASGGIHHRSVGHARSEGEARFSDFHGQLLTYTAADFSLDSAPLLVSCPLYAAFLDLKPVLVWHICLRMEFICQTKGWIVSI